VSPCGRNGRITYIGINAHASASAAHIIPTASHRSAPVCAFFSWRSWVIKICLTAIQLCRSHRGQHKIIERQVKPQVGKSISWTVKSIKRQQFHRQSHSPPPEISTKRHVKPPSHLTTFVSATSICRLITSALLHWIYKSNPTKAPARAGAFAHLRLGRRYQPKSNESWILHKKGEGRAHRPTRSLKPG
jgi:hypothetical protein